MTLRELQDHIPEYAKDIKLNLETILNPEGLPGLAASEVAGVAVACSYSVNNSDLAEAIATEGSLSEETVRAAKGAAAIMAMNNVYYRSMHLIEDQEITKLPARLRMNIIGKPGIEKKVFELMCLSVSSISGCGKCLNAHIEELRKHGTTTEGLHSAIRIAAVVNAANQALRQN